MKAFDRNNNGPAAKATRISERLEQRLAAYALAAGAAGVGLLAAAPARADVIYTPANQTLTNGTLIIDLNHDAVSDFQFTNFGGSLPCCVKRLDGGQSVFFRTLNVNGLGNPGNQVMLQGSSAAALERGALIGPGANFGSPRAMAGEVYVIAYSTGTGQGRKSAYPFGPWANNGERFLGLMFDVSGQEHFGWAELTVTTGVTPGFPGSPFVTATLTGYAYDTVAGQSLTAGQGQTSEPGTLGLLALGSLGLGLWRRRKRA
ncbi:MAG TPA: PEP-CTERM sorting domain-containing protein [Terriglobia bacterium]|nr:PEP-CTERM sorting domain-containing protein [Terriglobia bacterium]